MKHHQFFMLPVFFIFSLILILIGCNTNTSEPSAPLTGGPSDCTQIPITEVNEISNNENMIVTLLIDSTDAYRGEGHFERAVQSTSRFFNQHVGLNSLIYVGRIGTNTNQSTTIKEIVVDYIRVDRPTIDFSQGLPELIIPTSTPKLISTATATPRDQLDQLEDYKTQTAQPLVEAASMTAEALTLSQTEAAFNCDILNPAIVEQNAAVATYQFQLQQEREELLNEYGEVREQLVEIDINSRPIFETLAEVGNLFLPCESSDYSSCLLIVFSDMLDWRYNREPQDVGIEMSLNNVDVIVVLFDCELTTDECLNRQERWAAHFSYAGASSVRFVTGPDDEEDTFDLGS